MKYMGSKRPMLKNGLGDILVAETKGARRFVDLFAGSGSVAIYVARNVSISVQAYDLQTYSAVLASGIISRRAKANTRRIWRLWRQRARRRVRVVPQSLANPSSVRTVARSRKWCADQNDLPITSAYGGHYFSPTQAVWLDALRATLPTMPSENRLALAALVDAASECVASPGHTAQPFQPTVSAKQHLFEAWRRDVPDRTKAALDSMGAVFAKRVGRAFVGDANVVAETLAPGDVVFVDPPYSALHYSRFYHVLESVAIGSSGLVDGVGRYPERSLRPRSSYSVKSESRAAMASLLKTLASRRCKVILTFPDHSCSNGLSGQDIRGLAEEYFCVRTLLVDSTFSTLGGSGIDSIESEIRGARRIAKEMILVMSPLGS